MCTVPDFVVSALITAHRLQLGTPLNESSAEIPSSGAVLMPAYH